jgi:mono/diheme cytochrome c family protein
VDRSFEPKPEWNFLFLYQAIKAFRGALEPVGTVGLPLVATILLLLVPFIDRRKERDPFRRPLAMGVLLASIAGLVALTVAGALSKPGVQASAPTPGAASATAAGGTESASGPGAGKFKSLGCAGCHRIGDSGGAIGPDLTSEGRKGRSRDWLGTQIRNPGGHNPKTLMPAFPKLDDAELSGLIDFLEGLGAGTSKPAPAEPVAPNPAVKESTAPASAPAEPARTAAPSGSSGDTAADMIGNPEIGARFFASICQSCHGSEGKGGVPNPGSEDGSVPPLNPIDRELFSPAPGTFAASLDRFLQHGSTPPGPGPALKMPAFGDASTLTQPEIANLEAYVLRLNGVSRDAILHPGIKPALFFGLVLAAFGALGLGLLGVRFKSRTKS